MSNYDLANYPLPAFHFQVDFLFEDNTNRKNFLGPAESSFTEVSGIKGSTSIEEYAELGFPGQPHGMITGRKVDNLVLKRGLTYNAKLVSWFETCLYRKQSIHAPVLVSALSTGNKKDRGKPLLSWLFIDAYPVSIDISGFNSMDNGYLIETVELHYSYFISLDTKGNKNMSSDSALFNSRRTREVR